MIVSCGDNTRVLNTSDFYSTEASSSYSGYYDVTGFQGEQALTSAILSVTSEETPGMYVLQGHNESISTSLSTLFTSAGYTANTLNLTEEKKIPDDASVLVLSLPQTDYTEDEINLIDAFVKNGGDLMVFDGTSSRPTCRFCTLTSKNGASRSIPTWFWTPNIILTRQPMFSLS